MGYSRRKSATSIFKLCCALFIILFYTCYIQFHPPSRSQGKPLVKRHVIQHQAWNKTGKLDKHRRDSIQAALIHSHRSYRLRAWGRDEILPVSGQANDSANAWASWIVESCSTLAVMGLWNELSEQLDYVANKMDFAKSQGSVDTHPATIGTLASLVSILDMADSGLIATSVCPPAIRRAVLAQTKILAGNILMAYDSATGLPWPRIDLDTGHVNSSATIHPAAAGTNFLEFCALGKLTGDVQYCSKATMAWARLVRNQYVEESPGLVGGEIAVGTDRLVGRHRQWDSYYEYLIKASLLFPNSPNAKVYRASWLRAADAVRHNLTSRSAPFNNSAMAHLYLGRWNGPWYINEMKHSDCSVPGNLMLGGRVAHRPDLIVLGLAILETCRHVYTSAPTNLAPELFSWQPAPGTRNATFAALDPRQYHEQALHGFWASDAHYLLRPDYVESLFYAYRITGQERYRDWAWQVFESIQRHCKSIYGFAAVQDVMLATAQPPRLDKQPVWWIASTLKYLYLIFEDVHTISLDDWTFTAGGHLVRSR